jgi:hypothetical protein
MWGTTPPCAKLIGDSGNGFEAALISDCRLFRPLAENQPQCLLGLLQHYPPEADIHEKSVFIHNGLWPPAEILPADPFDPFREAQMSR